MAQIPNTNFPLVDSEGLITQAWQRALQIVFAAASPSGAIIVFVGASPPSGWTAVGGMPVLPAGKIWIQKT